MQLQQLYEALTPELVFGLYTRGLGLVFLISYASLAPQVVSAAGRRGGFPAHRRLAQMRRDFPLWRRLLHFPSLLWLNDSDAMLRLLTWIGIGAACAVIYGGEFSPYALAVCYVCYLSLDLMVGLIYPWDCLLLEASVLSMFLPATHALPELAAVAAPAPLLAWAHRLLLFRVMFGFGKQKFMGSTSKDLTYLKGFLIGQPLPSPLGWYMQKLPNVLLKGAVLFMFFVEIPAPFMALWPGIPSLICAVSTTLLMIGIQATGNFGYFSILTIVACIPLLDNVTPTQVDFGALFGAGAANFTNAFVIVHTLCSVLAFPFNSWFGQCWHLWAIWYRLPPLAQLPFAFVRLLHPFRWLHPYGVFPPNTGPGIKTSILVEASWDGRTWQELDFHYAFCNAKSKPRFIAPYHPRGDQAVIYETFGLAPTSLVSTTMGPYDPYGFGTQPAAHVLGQRILEGYAQDFVKGEALAQHGQPPSHVRITTVLLEPTSIAHHRATGEWWKRTYIGPHMGPRTLDPELWDEFLPEPELFHFDAITWRRRSRLKRLIDGSLQGREDPMQLALAESDGELTREDVERFWNELVPAIGARYRDLDTLPDVVADLRGRYSRKQQRALQRLLGRFSLLLVAKLEPLYLGRMGKPLIAVPTYSHLWMLSQRIIAQGKDAYLAALAAPQAVATAEAPALLAAPQTGIYYYSLFRYEAAVFDAQKARLLAVLSAPYDEQQKNALLATKPEDMPPFQRRLDAIAKAISGYYCIAQTMLDNFKGPRFDLGYPELYPVFRELPSGEVVVGAYRTAPQDREVAVPVSSLPAE